MVHSNVLISGTCPDATTIESDVTFEAGADKAGLSNVAVKGTVFVQGAESVTLGTVRPGGAPAPAVKLDDRTGKSSASITNSVIEGAKGAGILSYGGDVTITQSTVRLTQPSTDGTDSCGICVRASARVPHDDSVGGYWDARASSRPTVEVHQSLIEDNAQVGMSVIGADATVTQTVVRSTGGPGVPDQEVGISVEERSYGSLRASLTLRQAIVQGASHIGVRGREAHLDIADSVVRSIGRDVPTTGELRCLGNGIRARWDRLPDVSPALHVARSLLESTHETGILVEGGSASVEDTIIRDTAKDPCSGDFGDGVTAYAYPFAPTSAALQRVRIDRSARAGLSGSIGDREQLRHHGRHRGDRPGRHASRDPVRRCSDVAGLHRDR